MNLGPLSTDLIVIAAVVLVFVSIITALWRIRSTDTLTYKPPPPPNSQERFKKLTKIDAPRYEDLVPGEFTKGSYSSQLQTNTDNLRIEDLGGKTRFVVNGVAYNYLGDIPEAELRKMAKKMLQKSFQPGLMVGRGGIRDSEILRQVIAGNQQTIEARGGESSASIQRQGKNTRYIVNGLTYYKFNEIPDPDMRRKIKQLMKMMV